MSIKILSDEEAEKREAYEQMHTYLSFCAALNTLFKKDEETK